MGGAARGTPREEIGGATAQWEAVSTGRPGEAQRLQRGARGTPLKMAQLLRGAARRLRDAGKYDISPPFLLPPSGAWEIGA